MALKPTSGCLSPREIAARIRAERERLGLSLAAAAGALGVTKQTYSTLECVANPRLSRLLDLRAIGYDLHAIAPELYQDAPTPADVPRPKRGRPRKGTEADS